MEGFGRGAFVGFGLGFFFVMHRQLSVWIGECSGVIFEIEMIRSAVVLQRFVNLSHTHQFLKVKGSSVDFYRKGQVLSLIQNSMGGCHPQIES